MLNACNNHWKFAKVELQQLNDTNATTSLLFVFNSYVETTITDAVFLGQIEFYIVEILYAMQNLTTSFSCINQKPTDWLNFIPVNHSFHAHSIFRLFIQLLPMQHSKNLIANYKQILIS